MFFFRPNASWQQGQQQGIRPFRGSGEQKSPVSSLFFTLSPRQKAQLFKNRRASDALGPRALMTTEKHAPFFVSTGAQTAQPGRLIIEYAGDDWISPEENTQLLELNDSADSLMNELSQTERDLSALSAQTGSGMVSSDLSLTAQQTFSRIDSLMQRWSLRADEIERGNSGTQWIAFNPLTGNRLASDQVNRRSGIRPAASPLLGKTVTHQRILPGAAPRAGDRRQLHIKHELASKPVAPSAQIRHRRLRLNEKYATSNTEKLSGLRQQMNQMAAKPAQMSERAGGLRRIALARLASLHGTIDHMAHELHEHRQNIEHSIQQRMDRRRAPRAPSYPAPVLRPKVKGDTTV